MGFVRKPVLNWLSVSGYDTKTGLLRNSLLDMHRGMILTYPICCGSGVSPGGLSIVHNLSLPKMITDLL